MLGKLLYFPFLITTVLLYWLMPKQKIRNLYLTLVSFAFIGYLDAKAVIVVIGLTIFTYGIALWMERTEKHYPHTIGVIGLVAILIIFKYLGFLTGTLNSLLSFVHGLPAFQIEKLFLPLGISYIIFKYISYLTDIKWEIIKKGRFLDFLCYGSLFTIFIAGPIEQFVRLKPQLENERIKFQTSFISIGMERIVYGLAKKYIVADWIGYFINPVFQGPEHYTSFIRIIALIGFSLQVYFDFAGYSDIAIGSSKLFGLTIMENFNNPFFAPNISQFWRRWHISLSDWIRDYLFVPLSKKSNNKFWMFVCTPIIAMGLCGLWHGSAWHFAIWGVWHGAGIAIWRLWTQFKRNHRKLAKASDAKWFQYMSVFITFVFVSIGTWWLR
jgi:alginate O-acetyltransferase complex protein AlgI